MPRLVVHPGVLASGQLVALDGSSAEDPHAQQTITFAFSEIQADRPIRQSTGATSQCDNGACPMKLPRSGDALARTGP